MNHPEHPGRHVDIDGPDRFLDREQVAQLLGLSKSQFDKHCALGPHSGLIPTPVYRIGVRYRWKLSDVLAWLETKRADL